ncbi:MAG TPA: tetratricopeptide repeat protein [Vicinamibacterales bacterium]|nr:tetratricopeptide repeat protein [Vicinamibacterales bacterium]
MSSLAALLACSLLAGGQLAQPPAEPSPEETALRAAVQQYYDAQASKDADAALAFWSASANPRPTREAFAAVFGEGEDQFTVNVQRVTIQGADARVRVLAVRTRLVMRDGRAVTSRTSLQNSQSWRKEDGGWKLLRDAPFAAEIADEIIAAAPGDRPALFSRHPRADLVQARLAISERATMAITLQRDYVRGKELFGLALDVSRAAGDRVGETNSLHNIAQAAYFLGDRRTATEFYQQELAVGREVDDQTAIAAASFGLATVAYSRGEYTPALGFYRDALAVYEKQDHGSAIGRAVVSIGNVQFLQADYDAATASYRRGLAVLVESQDMQGASLARSGLARVYAAQGDLAAALDAYRQVLADARTRLSQDARLRSEVANALESIGEIYFRLGSSEQARTNVEEARTLSAADAVAVGRLSATLGLIELFAGRFDAALAAYIESRTRFDQAKMPDGAARAWVGIGFSHAARDQWGDAIAAYRTAIKMFDEQKLDEDGARAWLGLSMAESGAGDHTAALASARTVGATAEKIRSEDLTWRAAVRSGEALRKLSRLDEARREFQRGIATIDRLAAEAPINPGARGQLDDSATAWTGLAMTFASAGDPLAALAAAEARRAHVRRVQLAAFQRDITRGMTPDEQSEEQTIVRELISTRAQVRAERDQGGPDSARLAQLQQQLAALVARRTEQQNRLYARLPELQVWRGLRAGAGADDLAALVPDDKHIVIEYLLGDDELLILTVVKGESTPDVKAAVVSIDRQKLAEQIGEAMKPASLRDAASWKAQAAPLAGSLLTPVASRLAGRERCVIVADDLLWKLPFEALPVADAPLAAALRVSYATSLATLAAQRRVAADQPAQASVSAAIFAAPVIPEPIRAQIALAQPSWKEPDVETARAAADALRSLYAEAATFRAGADATEAAARAAFEAADVLHTSAPFQVSGATPLFSYVVFSGSGDAAATDGRWEVRDWFGATSHARVLILADATSFAASGAGGALDIIAWAAASAGVPALIVPRAPADGFVLDPVLTAFHAAISKGTAVRDAWMQALSRARDSKGAAPSEWSGARLIGAAR